MLPTDHSLIGNGPTIFVNNLPGQVYTTCPTCHGPIAKDVEHLAVLYQPDHMLIVKAHCRARSRCNLLIANRGDLEDRMRRMAKRITPSPVGRDYIVAGTVPWERLRASNAQPTDAAWIRAAMIPFRAHMLFDRDLQGGDRARSGGPARCTRGRRRDGRRQKPTDGPMNERKRHEDHPGDGHGPAEAFPSLRGRLEQQLGKLTAYLQRLGEENPAEQTPLERAQQVIYDAFDAESSRDRIRLAREALNISPVCADAYVSHAYRGRPDGPLDPEWVKAHTIMFREQRRYPEQCWGWFPATDIGDDGAQSADDDFDFSDFDVDPTAPPALPERGQEPRF